ncbi:hypothetical protein HZU75_09655 [Chitinibacter fontanus]|uniref:PH domain-containing protein n=1 Tax=Chitinibacter fontanus TaxID=1737446 RepID=A0A7D5VA40_9NEIS|nr:hypothetical protein [Chitinibacter fontanus]QLI81778.1 hypothetical protein HZU75_09655 [Chitinibacter fontanus]
MVDKVIRITQIAPPKSALILGLECLFLLPAVTLLAYALFGMWGAVISFVLHALLLYVARNHRYHLANPITISIDDDAVWSSIGHATLWQIEKKDIESVEKIELTSFFRLQNEMLILHTKNNGSFSISSSDYYDPPIFQTLNTALSCRKVSSVAPVSSASSDACHRLQI